MEETISLKELYETVRKRMHLIFILTFAAATVSAVVSYFIITPVYQVSTQLLVNRTETETYNTSEIQTNLQLINTYNVIITSPRILDIVADELDLEMTTNELKEKISVESEQNSQIINLSIEDPDPNKAALIANKIAEVFQNEIAKIMKVDNVSILSQAEVTDLLTPVKPKPVLNIAIAIVIGLMIGVGLAFLLEYLDNTIKTEQDIERYLDLPVLGVVSHFNPEDYINTSTVSRAKRRGQK
ncbi:YveK family protein [Fervidibacillus halotolerans]|uniref:Wzz/FepE/Etk N-terminal domain-containing protein n=1 Tax=Fervidibacillus halotolerans TaxID=2980027 RepID=A0A9E8RYD5_9BACI|nr:Wzz/FepE/Etk N-terminal domain-containing protein [Fervidibacillus halotolerans]WAA12123.1 Wzz/FepE/Etk N-terminal domain-containing protein [Fervidibacillus halotolerans]